MDGDDDDDDEEEEAEEWMVVMVAVMKMMRRSGGDDDVHDVHDDCKDMNGDNDAGRSRPSLRMAGLLHLSMIAFLSHLQMGAG